ncbi:hypothetical protein THOB06_150133 [Vibrio rotiferianus]|nr:hypothetical protein THOG10_150133 [Vibrio rotiferianus]CAH1567085.1 hypothetical protein THOB06_150133 [Vibrio rotiferianus]CAH1578121.1 hypothetical protein THOE12_50340 [Vibrio rotiferianus]
MTLLYMWIAKVKLSINRVTNHENSPQYYLGNDRCDVRIMVCDGATAFLFNQCF